MDVDGNIRLRGALFDVNNQSGSANQVLISTGSGVDWVDAAPAGAITGITVKDEGNTVGTAASISTVNFVGPNVTATASGSEATITIEDYVSNAGYSTNAGISTNIKGGSAGNLVYQVGVDSTGFVANGTSGQVLISNGSSAPSWVTAAPAGAITGITIREEGSVVGTANSISSINFVSGNLTAIASGVGATVTLTDNPVFSDLTVNGITNINSNLNVSGNITVGGTTAFITVNELIVKDKDIVLGFTTNAQNQDVSNDTTANHGGIAIASTEGTPLIDISVAGIDEIPSTYKQLMWIKGGTLGAGTTDAWLFNYGVGIGSTQVPNGVRLAVGGVHITDNEVTANRFNGTATDLDINGLPLVADPQSEDFIALYDVSGTVVGKATIQNAALQGVQGTQGTIGSQGTQGLKGEDGVIGVDGAQGTQGTTGSQGTQGIQGLQGTMGSQGTQGLQGLQGTQGNIGSQGLQGQSGTQGIQGTIGSQGSQGVNYDRAVTTYAATDNQTTFLVTYTVPFIEVYLNGVRLSNSEYTATNGTSVILTLGASSGDIIDLIAFNGGVLGAQGTQGTQGTQGVQGIQGTQGTQGTQGIQGITGEGTQGTQGIQGTQGTQGTQGVQGDTTIGIATAGGTVGTGVTLLDFRGPGISTVTVSAGIGTINIEGGGGSSTPDISPVMMGMIF